jgi:hypothetical protein
VERGLSRPILDKKLFSRLFVVSSVPAVLFGVRFDSKVGFGVLVAALALLSYVQSRHTQRETPAGLAAASRWLGLRAKLAEDEVFPTLPPIAVETWERHLAYGAALGIAPAAAAPIAMGPESDKHAWSSYGGRWRAVRIVYPQRLSWGTRPVWALLRAAARGAVAGLVLYLLAGPLFDRFSGFHGWEWLLALLLVPPAVVAAEAAIVLLASAADLASTREATGEILRLRELGGEQKKLRHYVAVDDGRSATIRAWIVRPELYRTLEQHQVVTASVTRHLRYVRSIAAASGQGRR